MHERVRRDPLGHQPHGVDVPVGAAHRPLGVLGDVSGHHERRQRQRGAGAERTARHQACRSRPGREDQRRQQHRGNRGPPDARTDLVDEQQPKQRARHEVRGAEHERERQPRPRWRRLTEAGGQQPSVPPERKGRRRDERRDEVDEAPLVAHVVQHQLQRPEHQPPDQQPLRGTRALQPRDETDRRDGPDHEGEPHAGEDVVDHREPARAIDEGANGVGGLPRDRHLPVVEAVLLPVRQHEESGRGQGAERQARQRERGSPTRLRLQGSAERPRVAPRLEERDHRHQAEGGDERHRCCLGEVRGERGQSRREAPRRAVVRAHGRPEARDHEGHHRRLHQRGPRVHHPDVVGREQACRDQLRRWFRPSAARPHQAGAPTGRPPSMDTLRACQRPTPNARNAPYSRPVNTGAM